MSLMLVHPTTDEILERLWYARERDDVVRLVEDLEIPAPATSIEAALEDLVESKQVKVGPPLELLPQGEERGRGIVRRHRLAEILFTEVLEVDRADAEASACELEHILSERVVDRVCTFLGHPPKCSHGKPIPPGSCCRIFEKRVDPLTVRLVDLVPGNSGKIVFIAPKSQSRLNRLSVLGIVPGTAVRLVQKKPAVVLSAGETSIAIEDDMAREIWVRPEVV